MCNVQLDILMQFNLRIKVIQIKGEIVSFSDRHNFFPEAIKELTESNYTTLKGLSQTCGKVLENF